LPEKYVPKHRGAPPRHRGDRPARLGPATRKIVLLPSVAALATGLAVTVGVGLHDGSNGAPVKLSAGPSTVSAADLAARAAHAQAVSRSDENRLAQAAALKQAEIAPGNGVAVTRSEDLSKTDPKTLARALMPQYGLASSDFACIDEIWTGESGWNVHADNPSSSAYGIPQALPGSKMASMGADWRNNPETQIRWGLQYIKGRYGTACAAGSFKQGHGYY
jgi:hypothetical protein